MFKRLILFSLLLCLSLFAEDNYLEIQGYLGHDELKEVNEKIERLKHTEGGKVIVALSSSSGDLQEAFDLAQNLFELRMNNKKFVLVYIQGRAVGPAAIIPFLADQLMTTPIVAWGDIVYGAPKGSDLETIRKRVRGFIDDSLHRSSTLQSLADAMVDPHYQFIYEKGETAKIEHHEKHAEALILNQKGMQSLGLVTKVLNDEEFAQNYSPTDKSPDANRLYQGVINESMSQEELHRSFRKHIHYSQTEENLIGFIEIGPKTPINQSTYLYVKFALDEFKKRNVRFVVLHLDTPGGEVLSSLKIVDLLQNSDLKDGIPIIAMIDDWAVSAGAMLAYACRYIAVNSSSLMGAAEPVLMKEGGQMESASEKVNSALRAEFSNLANFYGRNPLIAEGMVDKDMIIVIRNHEIISLRSEEEIRTGDHHPDIIITDRGKLLTLNAEELIDLGVADFEVSMSLNPSEVKQAIGKSKWPAKQMPIFEDTYLSTIPNAFMIAYQDWRIAFFSVLSTPAIMSLLFIGLVLGFYIEINTPGFGIPGSIGLACLGLILLSSFATEAIHWIEVIILIGGLIFLAIELFVIPGFGIVGIIGIVLTIIGLFALMLPGIEKLNLLDWDSFELIGGVFMERLLWLSGALIFSILAIVLLAKFFSHRFFRFSKLVLHGEQEGYLSGIPRELMPEEGELGETLSPLRPSGKIRIGGNIFDGMAQIGFIEKHVTIEVVRVERSKVIVRPVESKEL